MADPRPMTRPFPGALTETLRMAHWVRVYRWIRRFPCYLGTS